jgi:hypothetical protein
LCQGRDAEAYLLLSEAGLEKEPSARHALGICHLRADNPDKAVSCFEQALALLKAGIAKESPVSGLEPPPTDETYIRLAVKQIAAKAYLRPMDADFCSRFPKTAKQTVLLSLIHAYRETGNDEQARRLAAGLAGKEFEEYKKSL